ncbi:hypothetical protein BaRGS_00000482, partial [Batillaria attramentaria]
GATWRSGVLSRDSSQTQRSGLLVLGGSDWCRYLLVPSGAFRCRRRICLTVDEDAGSEPRKTRSAQAEPRIFALVDTFDLSSLPLFPKCPNSRQINSPPLKVAWNLSSNSLNPESRLINQGLGAHCRSQHFSVLTGIGASELLLSCVYICCQYFGDRVNSGSETLPWLNNFVKCVHVVRDAVTVQNGCSFQDVELLANGSVNGQPIITGNVQEG